MKQRIVVLGAGIVGVMSAYSLLKNGYDVILVDREKYPAMGCSRANGGQISICNAETWNKWSYVFKGIKWMFTKDAPFLVRPTLNEKKYNWLFRFLLKTINKKNFSINSFRTAALAKESSEIYKKIIEEENLQFDQRFTGMIHFYNFKNRKDGESSSNLFYEVDVALADEYSFKENDFKWDHVQNSKIDELFTGMKDIKGHYSNDYYYTKNDWTGDPHLFCKNLVEVMKEKYGLQTIFDFEVKNIDKNSISNEKQTVIFDKLIVCTGWEIEKHANIFKETLNVYPVKGYSITIPNADNAPDVSLLDDDKKIVCSKLGNRFRVAGTAEFADGDLDIRRDRIQPLLNWVKNNFPNVDYSNYESWSCNRPMTPDMMPFIKISKYNDSIIYHGGHGHLGWTLSAVTSMKYLPNVILENKSIMFSDRKIKLY